MTHENAVTALYRELLAAWDRRDAPGMARLFTDTGIQIGFDGSLSRGPREIELHLTPIFANYLTARFIALVREVQVLNAETVLLRGDAGMIPAGAEDLNPAVNAIQTLVAVKREAVWRIALFQNTPAAFHGRPAAADAFTRDLRGVLQASRAPGAVGG